jgi:nucleotide-binding universal stress UspA family protein
MEEKSDLVLESKSTGSPLPKMGNLILAMDGSESSIRACDATATIAEGFKASVTVLYAVPKMLSIRAEPSMNNQARGTLEKAVALLASYEGVRASSEVIAADTLSVSESLIDYIEKKKCDLVVCGSRGLGGLERMLLGSVSNSLVSHCPFPVMVVRSSSDTKITFKKILVATDGSESAKKGAELAISFGKTFSSKLTFAYVVYTPPISYTAGEGDWFQKSIDDERMDGKRVTEGALSFARQNGVDADARVIDDMSSPASALTKTAEGENYDLITVGTRGLSGFKRLALGSVASGVVHYSKGSVLVVR